MSFYGRQNYIPEERNQVPMSALIAANFKPYDRISQAFATQGPLGRAFPGYVYRDAQHQLAQLAFHAFKLRKPLIAEAGTGTGKSFAVLIPAIEWALQYKQPVVIATATNSLLDQYKDKELPLLQKILGEWLLAEYGQNFSWSWMKGRGNLYCHQAGEDANLPAFQAELAEIQDWLATTATGDLGELPFEIGSQHYLPLRQAITSDSDTCPGVSECAHGPSCFYYGARDKATRVNLILCSQATLATDLVMEASGGTSRLLPEYGAVVIDEAHQFQSYVQSSLEQRMGDIPRLTKRLARNGCDSNLLTLSSQFMALIRAQMGEADRFSVKGAKMPDNFWRSRDALVGELEKCENVVLATGQQNLLGLVSACAKLRTSLQSIDSLGSDQAVWAERRVLRDGSEKINLHMVPVDVSFWLESRLWKKCPAVLTSATLATSSDRDGFGFISRELGLTDRKPLELRVDSPFNWDLSALYIFPGAGYLTEADLERQRGESFSDQSSRWAAKIWPLIEAILSKTEGRAFVLCTSAAVASRLYDLHQQKRLSWPAMAQGIMGKQATIDWFKSTPNPVLYATSTFWEGIDIAGDQLSCVIIDKIPFPNGSEPLEQAKMERLGQRESFGLYSVPSAITKLKQAVGRLIRTETDRGILVLLDPRFRSKGYGKTIARALPGNALEALERKRVSITAFLAGYSADSRPVSGAEEESARQVLLSGADLGKPEVVTQLRVAGALTDLQWSEAVQVARRYQSRGIA
jgi:ATP-dependent DNA helicase DinG